MIRTHANWLRNHVAPLSHATIVAGVALALSACGQSSGNYECLGSADCPTAQECLAGACVSVDTSTDPDTGDAADAEDDVAVDIATDTPVDVDTAPDVTPDVVMDPGPDPIDSDVAEPRCGDGTLNPGEQCDNGTDNSDELPGACRTDCTYPRCGDAVVDSDEECELNAPAPEGWRCSFETCRYTLESSCVTCGQCLGEDSVCDGGYCTQECDEDDVCPFGSDCIDNLCVLFSVGVCTGEICDILGDEDLDGFRECDDDDCETNPVCAAVPCEPDAYEPNDHAGDPTGLNIGDVIYAEICGVEHDFFRPELDPSGNAFALRLDFISSEYGDLDAIVDSESEIVSFADFGMEFGIVDDASEAVIDVFNYYRRPDSVPYRLELLPIDDSDCPIDRYGDNHSVSTAAPLSSLGIAYPVVCNDGPADFFVLSAGPTPDAAGTITFTTSRAITVTALVIDTGRVLIEPRAVLGVVTFNLSGDFRPNQILLQITHPGQLDATSDLSPIAYEIQAAY